MAGTRYKAAGKQVAGLLNASDDASAVFNLGFRVQDELGNGYMYAQNSDSGAWAAGDILVLVAADASTNNNAQSWKKSVAGDAGKRGPIAVALNAITAAQYGFILVQGVATAHLEGTAASISAGDDLQMSATANKLRKQLVASTDATTQAVARALEAASSDTDKEIYVF